MKTEEKKVFLVNIAFAAVVAAIVFFVVRFMLAYLLPFIIGVVLAFVMQKPAAFISQKMEIGRRRIRISKGKCAAVLVTVSFIAVAGAAVLLGWLAVSGIASLASLLPGYMESASAVVSEWKDALDVLFAERLPAGAATALEGVWSGALSSISQNVTGFVSGMAAGIAKNVPAYLLSFVVTIVASFYIAKDFDKLLKFLKSLLGKKTSLKIAIIKDIAIDSVFKYIKGYLLMMCITFFELMIGFFILGVKAAPLLAVIVAIVDLLPVLGTGTILVPWAVISLVSGHIGKGLGVLLLYVLITVIRNILEPKVIGDQVGINPLLTLITLFVGLRLAGIAGMFILPISAVVIINYYKRQLEEERSQRIRNRDAGRYEQSELPLDDEDY